MDSLLLVAIVLLLLVLSCRINHLKIDSERRDERQEGLAGERYEELRRFAFRLEDDITRRNNDEEEATDHSTKGQQDGDKWRGP